MIRLAYTQQSIAGTTEVDHGRAVLCKMCYGTNRPLAGGDAGCSGTYVQVRTWYVQV